MKRIELGLRMVALAILFAGVLELKARGDDCACLPVGTAAGVIAAQGVATPYVPSVGDQFLCALNAERQKFGLQQVIGKLSLERVAAINNAGISQGRGPHNHLGGYGQCAGIGYPTMQAALAGWLGSPSHRALILAADLTEVGYHQMGTLHTVSTWQGGVQTIVSKPAIPRPIVSPSDGTVGLVAGLQSSAPGQMTTPSPNTCGDGQPACVGSPGGPGQPWVSRPFARLLSRLRIQVSFGVRVNF